MQTKIQKILSYLYKKGIKKDDKNKTSHPNGFLKAFKVKATFFKWNAVFGDRIDLLISPIFWNTSSVFECHFDIDFLYNLSYINNIRL